MVEKYNNLCYNMHDLIDTLSGGVRLKQFKILISKEKLISRQ